MLPVCRFGDRPWTHCDPSLPVFAWKYFLGAFKLTLDAEGIIGDDCANLQL